MIGQLLQVVLHLVQNVVDLRVADLIKLVRAVGAFLDLICILRLHSLIPTEHNSHDLRAHDLLFVASSITAEKPLQKLKAELVLRQSELQPRNQSN